MRVDVTALIIVLFFTSVRADDAFHVAAGTRQLFLDDEGIESLDNLQRTMHPPTKRGAVIVPDQPWETNLQIRCAPQWDPIKKCFKLWMITSTPIEGVAGTTYAESPDGLHWTKPLLRQWSYRGSLENNFVSLDADSSWPGNAIENAIYDPDETDPERRFKGFLGALGRQPIVSPDGIHWKRLPVPELPSQDESNLSYDRPNRRFIATLKITGEFGRTQGIWTSSDFQHWTNTGVRIGADQEDQQQAKENIRARLANKRLRQPRQHDPARYNADVYNVGLFRYEGVYVGLPAVYYAVDKDDGFHLIQLISSRDLTKWSRLGNRQSFIGPSPVGANAFDLTQLLPPSSPVIRETELWFYYTGTKYREEPAQPEPDGQGAICLAVLRRDGFISLDAGDTAGRITTKKFLWRGKQLVANFNSQSEGEVFIEVLDENDTIIAATSPLTGDQHHAKFEWSEGSPDALQGQQVRLRFTLKNASLYSYWLEAERG